MKQGVKKKWQLILICLVSLGIFGVILLFGINYYVSEAIKSRILTPENAGELDNVDCILVLGAAVHQDNQPSLMLEDRLDIGIQLYKAGVSKRLLMSGDHGRKNYDEVNVMKQYAIDAGVPSEDIFMDHAGFSTYESLYRARDIFQAKKVVVITQKYHLYRALYDGRGLGLDAYGVSSDLRSYAGQTKRDIREVLARAKDFLYVIVKPRPTYLGDAIPVGGNGDITNDKQ